MKTTEAAHPPDRSTSVDLWKFFEERGAKLKESMFSVATWIVGFAAAVLGFAVKEGFVKGHLKVADPVLVISLGLTGLLLLAHAVLVLRDYGKHINRTFARAAAARDGISSPRQIWQAGKNAEGDSLPPACWHLLIVMFIFAAGFMLLIYLALTTSGSKAMSGMLGSGAQWSMADVKVFSDIGEVWRIS